MMKYFGQYIISSLILLLSIFVNADSLLDTRQQLKQELSKSVSVLDREMVTYRYEIKNQFEPNSVQDVVGRIRGWPERFYNKSVVTGDVAGPGTYLAVDPYASRSFGGANPQLYVLTLKKGINILNLSNSINAIAKNLIKKVHQDLECKEKNGTDEILIAENKMDLFSLRLSSTEKCREFVTDLVRDLQIHAIFYNYMASNSLSECRDRSTAINVISSNALDFSKIAFFSNEKSFDTADYAVYVKSLYHEANDDFSLFFLTFNVADAPTTLEKIIHVDQNLYLKWKQEKIFSCGSKCAYENNMENDLMSIVNSNLEKYFKDLEVQDLLYKLVKAFYAKLKTNSTYFQLSNIVKVAKLQYLATGLRQDDATFQRYMFLTNNQFADEKYKNELKEMLQTEILLFELKPDLQLIQDELQKIGKNEIDSPDLYIKILNLSGIKGNYAIISLNQITAYRGKVVISSIDPNKSFMENLQISKANYKSALAECVQMYSDEKLSYEEIQKTDCAMKLDWN